MTDERRFVREEVGVDDPDLSPEANRLLTEEVREALGTDHAEVPADRTQDIHRLPDRPEGGLATLLGANRMLVVMTFAALVVIGAIVTLATGAWWALVVAVAVHAVGTLIVATVVLRVSTTTEHIDPNTAARLQDEGVADPDREVSGLVERYASPDDGRGASDVVTPGSNRVTRTPAEDPARASAEQQTAFTPSSEGSEPAGPGEEDT